MVKTILGIDGMMCGMCESHMNDAIRNNFDVKKVTSSHSKKQTEVISEEALDESKLKEVVEKTGYQLTSVETEPYEKKGFSLFHRQKIIGTVFYKSDRKDVVESSVLFSFGLSKKNIDFRLTQDYNKK